jgi:hypothetical protein
VFVLGDAHGQIEPVTRILRAAGLIDDESHWAGGDSVLWLTGDFCDRGPDGVGVVRLVMRLQEEAAAVGGRVGAVLGNHEFMILGAVRFPDHRASFGSTYHDLWSFNGGRERDRESLNAAEITWLSALPAMALEDEMLLVHCDATFYADLGESVEAVNAHIADVLRSSDLGRWDALMEVFFERGAFTRGELGKTTAERFLRQFGGAMIVHGHTPIPYITGQDARDVTGPEIYAGGLCMDVDGGIYMGGCGFIVELDERSPTRPS